jgi:hypothetical protein
MLASVLVSSPAAATEDAFIAKNSVYLEGFGPGLAYSVNYERIIEDIFAVRAGLSYMYLSASASAGETSASASSSWLSVPVTASYIGIRSGNHALELAAGPTLVYASAGGSSMGLSASGSGVTGFGTAMVGYRRQPPDGGFQFRVGLGTIFGPGLSISATDPEAWGALPWGYMSFGGSF